MLDSFSEAKIAMNEVLDAFLQHDLQGLITQVGYAGVWGIIFAESGLLFGFFLPGDSLIFTAGLLASPLFGIFDIKVLLAGAWVAAVVGDNIGYWFGEKAGPRLFRKDDSFFFKKDNVIKAQEFYEKHGGKAIVIARFMPIVRTFAPIVAGVGKMDRKRFMFFNVIGATLWVFTLGLGGFYLGSLFPDAEKYLFPIVMLIVIISLLPPGLHLYKENKETMWEKARFRLKKLFKYRV